MSKIKNGGLDQYRAKPFEQQHFGTAGWVMMMYRTDKEHKELWCNVFSVIFVNENENGEKWENNEFGKCTQLSCLGVPVWLIVVFFVKLINSFIHLNEDRIAFQLQVEQFAALSFATAWACYNTIQ